MAAKRKTAKKTAAETADAVDPRSPRSPSPTVLRETIAEVGEVVKGLKPPEAPRPGDLVAAMIHYTFADGVPDGCGQEALRRIQASFVDLNEFRVTEAFEVAEALADLGIPDLFERCRSLRAAVGQIYNDQNSVSLEFLREASVTERNQFLARVPALTGAVSRWVLCLLSFEECIFSNRSTLRVQQRLGLDPKLPGATKFFEDLRAMLAPFGHLPLQVALDRTDGRAHDKPVLSPASLVCRLAPAKP
jgi:hypothetical protein